MGKIFRTPVYKSDLRSIYAYSLRHFGERVADETMRQIQAVEKKAANDPSYGKLEAHYHSDFFRYRTIRNSQTVFFHHIGDDVVMITAGYCGRNWGAILKTLESEIKQHIQAISDIS